MSKYKYVNARGDEIDLCRRPLWAASFKELRSYEYERIEQNGVMLGYTTRTNVEKPMTFQYYGAGRDAFYSFYEEFYRIVNYDILANTTGRLYYGDFYGIGNFPKQAVTTYDPIRRLWIAELPFCMPREVWYREMPSYTFSGDQDDPGDVPAVPLANYPSNYEYGYTSGNRSRTIVNDSAFASPFRLTVYGACQNPTVTIGGHIYNVNVDIPANQRLVIDSTTKEIYIEDAENRRTNKFAFQNHDADKYIFEPIQPGTFTVRYQNIPRMVLTLFEERNAPRWS